MENKIRIIAHLNIKIIEEHKRLYSPFGLSPTLNVVGGWTAAESRVAFKEFKI